MPFAGTLLVTVPAGIEVRSAPDAVPGTAPEGLTTLRWNLVLAPPLGSYQQTHELVMRATSLAVPSDPMEVVPTTTSADPSAAFAASLLDSSVKGNASLAEGLTTLDDNAAELAAGAGSLSRGLAELEAGAAALTQGADDQLVPGAQQIASGSAQVATGAGKPGHRGGRRRRGSRAARCRPDLAGGRHGRDRVRARGARGQQRAAGRPGGCGLARRGRRADRRRRGFAERPAGDPPARTT